MRLTHQPRRGRKPPHDAHLAPLRTPLTVEDGVFVFSIPAMPADEVRRKRKGKEDRVASADPYFIGGHMDVRGAAQARWDPYAERYFQWRDWVRDRFPHRLLLAKPTKASPILVSVFPFFHDGGHCDSENCRKALIDAIWSADKHVYGEVGRNRYDKENPRVVVVAGHPGMFKVTEAESLALELEP